MSTKYCQASTCMPMAHVLTMRVSESELAEVGCLYEHLRYNSQRPWKLVRDSLPSSRSNKRFASL